MDKTDSGMATVKRGAVWSVSASLPINNFIKTMIFSSFVISSVPVTTILIILITVKSLLPHIKN
eukprot:scaffold334456_cov21-Prasinocladus_malaysianus.AAC.1